MNPTVRRIQAATARQFNIPIETMVGKHRYRKYARPRQVAMYLSRTLTRCSLPEIGRRFGGRDHTTVLWGHRNVTALLTTEPQAFAIRVSLAQWEAQFLAPFDPHRCVCIGEGK